LFIGANSCRQRAQGAQREGVPSLRSLAAILFGCGSVALGDIETKNPFKKYRTLNLFPQLDNLPISMLRYMQASPLDGLSNENLLRKERDFIATVLDTVGALIVVLDAQGRIVRFNRACEQTTGYTFAEAKGQCFWDLLLLPEEVPGVKAVFARLCAGDFPIRHENYWRTKDGRRRRLAWSNTVLTGEGEKVEFVIGTAQDITERRQAEKAVRETEERYKALFERSRDGVFLHDLEGRFIDANPAALAMFGYSIEEIPSLNFSHLLSSQDQLPRALAALKELVESDGQRGLGLTEFQAKREDGQYVTVETASCLVYREGRPFAVQGIVRDVTERKRAAEALRESEDRYRRLIECSPDTIYVQCEGRVAYINSAGLRLFGATQPEQIIGKPMLELIHPNWRDLVAERMRTLREDQGPVPTIAEQYLRLDGTAIDVEVAVTRFALNGKPAVLVIARDITQRKEGEKALRESEEKFRRIVNTAYEGIWIMDGELRTTFANARLAEMLGYQPGEMLGQTWESFLYEEDLPDHQRRFRNRRQGLSEQYERRFRRKDGQIQWAIVSVAPLLDTEGRFSGSFAMLTDMTEQKRVEEELRLSEQNYRQIFNAANDAIFIHDAETGSILDVNDAMLDLYGFTREEAKRLTVNESSLGEPPYSTVEARQWIAKAIAEGSQRLEWRARKKSGELFWAEVILKATEINGHRRVLAQAHDITERKKSEAERTQLEAQLRQAHKLEAIGTLAGGIAHDFNNILGAIICYTELAKEDTEDKAEVQDDLENVLKASDRAKELVKQILAFSRQTKQERRPTALQLVVKEAMRLLRSTLPATIEMVTQVGNDLPLVLADPTQIHQVLMNLCTNAAHAMRGQVGCLQVRLESAEVDDSFARLHPDLYPGFYVKLSVTDTGHGMDAETLNRIFEPFFTTKGPGEGTGLGLAVVHGIVKEHQGAIYASSRPGQGTVFELYFPALRTEGSQGESAPEALHFGHGERVLFVDDELALCQVSVSIMQRLGYQATFQTNPRAALELCQTQPHSFDVVLTDLTMPGMTGLDLAVAILKTRPDIPVLLASGLITPDMVAQAKSLGICEVILKPANVVLLGEALHKALENKMSPAKSAT
jgi:two-component system cell cycle sensor histidine kinase/response regulator CckA